MLYSVFEDPQAFCHESVQSMHSSHFKNVWEGEGEREGGIEGERERARKRKCVILVYLVNRRTNFPLFTWGFYRGNMISASFVL